MARPTRTADPAQDAAALLRRLGFAALTLLLPAAAFMSRRAAVVLLPIGVALLVAASALDGGFRPLRTSLGRLASSSGIAVAVFLLGWTGLSLAWVEAPGPAAERLGTGLGSLGLGLAGYLALPDRTRAANLYLVPIGVALAAVTAIVILLTSWAGMAEPDEGTPNTERGLAVLVLLFWPAVAWLRSRNRDAEAACLAILVALAAVLAPQPPAAVALSAGGLAYLLTLISPRLGIGAARIAMLAALAAVPVVAFAAGPLGRAGGGSAWGAAIAAWSHVAALDPGRLVTGYGFGSFLRDRLVGSVQAALPNTPLLQIWYDLGLLGATAAALAVWTGLRGAAVSYAPLLPGIVGAFAAGFTLASLGIGSGQAWLPAALAVLVLVFVAAERGQFRTRRPRARDALLGG